MALATAAAMALLAPGVASGATVIRSDVVVYGATPSGVLAAVTAARAGVSVTLLEPTRHVGGMLANGLDATDIGDKGSVGGYTNEFFDRVQRLYRQYGVDVRWSYEPHVAEGVFNDMIASTTTKLYLGARLAETGGVARTGTTITSLRMTDGRTFAGTVFIDASYEGDLMARAGVSYTVGRESTAQYGEPLAGVRPGGSAAVISGTLPAGVVFDPPGPLGSADDRVQGANYRICLSVNADKRVPLSRPADYDAARYEPTLKYLLHQVGLFGAPARLSWVLSTYVLVRGQFDANDAGPASLSLPGASYDWPDATYAERAQIEAWHRTFDSGLLWFLASDPKVPASVRTEMQKFGLCSTEYADNGNWPRQLYIREGRRMIGRYVMTQRDLEPGTRPPAPVGIGSYRIDSHYVSRWVRNGLVYVEGSLYEPYRLYGIPYAAITPRETEAVNLLVPVCLSVSHVAWAGLRMEPHLMMTGEGAGQAAALAIRSRRTVQTIDETALKTALLAHGALLTVYPSPHPVSSGSACRVLSGGSGSGAAPYRAPLDEDGAPRPPETHGCRRRRSLLRRRHGPRQSTRTARRA